MNLVERKQLTKTLLVSRELFPESKITPEGIIMYVNLLDESGYSLAALNAAIHKTLKTARFFPKVAEILDAAKSLEKTVTGKGLPTPGEAYAEIMRNARHDGDPSKWKYSCPAIEKAAKRFGTTAILLIPEDGANTARAQIMKIYEQEARREAEDMANREVLQHSALGRQHDVAGFIADVAKRKEM